MIGFYRLDVLPVRAAVLALHCPITVVVVVVVVVVSCSLFIVQAEVSYLSPSLKRMLWLRTANAAYVY